MLLNTLNTLQITLDCVALNYSAAVLGLLYIAFVVSAWIGLYIAVLCIPLVMLKHMLLALFHFITPYYII